MKQLNDQQAVKCVADGEFTADITAVTEFVAVILTQSWCPQWHAMQNYLAGLEMAEVYYFEYDLSSLFDEFREFKEGIWDNDQIPYVRYYRNGKLTDESNYVSEVVFKQKLGIITI